MFEIFNNLYVGDQNDYESIKGKVSLQSIAIVQACKEPYHRQALGYTGQGAPKQHPEYLIAKRDNRIILNLVDVDNPDWISPVIIDEAIAFIKLNLNSGKKVLIHCNQGRSRSAGIGFLYLAMQGHFANKSVDAAEQEYKGIYPKYSPAQGMREFIRRNWHKYCDCNKPAFSTRALNIIESSSHEKWQSSEGVKIT